jgi:hypothetical protein
MSQGSSRLVLEKEVMTMASSAPKALRQFEIAKTEK